MKKEKILKKLAITSIIIVLLILGRDLLPLPDFLVAVMMAKTTNLYVLLEPGLKEQAGGVLGQLAFNMIFFCSKLYLRDIIGYRFRCIQGTRILNGG